MSHRISLIGAGHWGKNIARVLSELEELASIHDANEQGGRALAATHEVPFIDDISQILSDDSISAVAIATPPSTHYSLAKLCLEAGKNVFVEKPVCLELNEAEEIKSIGTRSNKLIMVGHLLQYHPAFEKLKEIVHNGDLGRINYIYSNRLNLGQLRKEENVLWSFAPHDVSMILSLANEFPSSISGVGHCFLHKEIADITFTHMSFRSGLAAHIFVSWMHPVKDHKMVVIGEDGMIVFDDGQPWESKLTLFRHEVKWVNRTPSFDKSTGDPIGVSESEPLRNEMEEFVNCMDTGRRPRTDVVEAINVLKVLKTAQQSMETNT